MRLALLTRAQETQEKTPERSSKVNHAHLIGSIYEAALDPGRLEDLLAGFSSHAEASVGHIDIEDAASGKVMFVAVHHMDTDMRDQYLARYRAVDPRRKLLNGAAPGEWRLTQDHFDQDFLDRDPFFRDFAVPRGGGHGAMTHLDFGYFRGFVCLGRALRQGPFTNRARRRLADLTPHLQRASALTAQAGRSLAMQFAFHALLDHVADAVLLVTCDGRLLHCNASAQSLLDAGDGLQVANGFLRTVDPRAGALLARSIEAASRVNPRHSPGGSHAATLHVPRASGDPAWLVSLLPISPPTELGAIGGIPCAALWVRTPNRERRITPEWLQFALDITPAEARGAHAIFLGASLGDAAGQLGVAEATAKTHLASVFAKTGMRRQADLVRFISGLRPHFR